MYVHGQSEIIIEEGLKKCGFERDDFVGTTKLLDWGGVG
jgi:hypothetical protein